MSDGCDSFQLGRKYNEQCYLITKWTYIRFKNLFVDKHDETDVILSSNHVESS